MDTNRHAWKTKLIRVHSCVFVAQLMLSAQANWPAQLDLDVKSESWDAATRVGAALIDEIEAGRIFTRFSDVAEEVKARRLYASALDHTGKIEEAQHQRSIARLLIEQPDSGQIAAETARRLANLKGDVLATEIQPRPFPRRAPGRALIVAFWASWCAPCKPELERLASYKNPRAELLTFDVDHLDPALREYVPLESLQAPALPQLYIVDPAGNIRFHLTGFEDDGFFTRKLDWMIQAALK
jgi:thiol-disulfide isomerase/thioredoxin